MPVENQLSHRVVRDTNLPYISNRNPTATEPCYVTGSQDLLTSINGYAERRPGFATALEPSPTTFSNLQRLFSWDRTDGTFIEMACAISGGNSMVYKRVVGTDNSFVSIFTDTGNTTPFDFLVSNNTVYFSNGHVAKKWDPTNGLSNWGIAAPGSAPVGVPAANYRFWQPGTTYVQYTSLLDVNGNVQAASPGAVASGSAYPQWQKTPGTFTADGASQWLCLGPIGAWQASHQYTAAAVILDSNGKLQGTWNSINGTTGATPPSWNTALGGTTTDGTITWVNIGPGGQINTIGHQYVTCYGNSNTGHVSSPSPATASTGTILGSSSLSTAVSVAASTDAQVNQIRVFRSTDSVAPGSNAGVYFEISGSPVSNVNQTVTDTTTDSSLNISSIAPTPTFNDPPPAMRGMVYFSGRVWGINGNKVYFSGLEEIITGVPEESFPSGTAGNYWTFDQPPQALAVAGSGSNQGLGILCGGRLYAITGSSLDTFRRFLVSNRRGCRAVQCVSSLGGMAAWLDSAAQVWITDGNSLQELSVPIRPDLAGINPAISSVAFHSAGKYNWLLVSNGTKIFPYDLDLEQWMPPWNFACNYLFSGETSAGNYALMAATAAKALQLSTSAHNDNGIAYQPIAKTNLFSVVPDFGKRFSYIATGIYDQPSRTGLPWYFQVDTNNVSLADIAYMVDDDPLDPTTSYTSIFNSGKTKPEEAFNRQQGKNLVQNVWSMGSPTSRWVSFQIKGQNADDALKMYGFFVAYAEKR